MQNSNYQRDLRLDFVRGIALAIVLVDHVEDQLGVYVARDWTLGSFGFSDAADVFVFLSGLVFGVAYDRRLVSAGFVPCQIRALKRTFQIYWTYQVTVWVLLALAILSANSFPVIPHFLEVKEGVLSCGVQALVLRYQPYPIAILATYILILPFMPILLWLLRNVTWLAWLLSFGTYVAAQIFPDLFFSVYPRGRESDFNPFAWQFLFFIGMACHFERERWRAFKPVLVTAAILVLICGFMEAKVYPWLRETTTPQFAETLSSLHLPWVSKVRMQPVRLLHFVSLVYLSSLVLRPNAKFWTSRLARPFVVWGQYSLETYAFGVVLTTLINAVPYVIGPPAGMTTLIIDLDCCLLSLAFACCLNWTMPRRMSGARSKQVLVRHTLN